jgi:hypothetical protein
MLSQDCLADKYNHAIKTTANAVAKQTGLEADFFKARSAANTKVVKWARKNGLETPLAVVSFVVPIVYKKQLRFRTGDFTFKGTSNKMSLDWQIQF